jgi:hypothetical protein
MVPPPEMDTSSKGTRSMKSFTIFTLVPMPRRSGTVAVNECDDVDPPR